MVFRVFVAAGRWVVATGRCVDGIGIAVVGITRTVDVYRETKSRSFALNDSPTSVKHKPQTRESPPNYLNRRRHRTDWRCPDYVPVLWCRNSECPLSFPNLYLQSARCARVCVCVVAQGEHRCGQRHCAENRVESEREELDATRFTHVNIPD